MLDQGTDCVISFTVSASTHSPNTELCGRRLLYLGLVGVNKEGPGIRPCPTHNKNSQVAAVYILFPGYTELRIKELCQQKSRLEIGLGFL